MNHEESQGARLLRLVENGEAVSEIAARENRSQAGIRGMISRERRLRAIRTGGIEERETMHDPGVWQSQAVPKLYIEPEPELAEDEDFAPPVDDYKTLMNKLSGLRGMQKIVYLSDLHIPDHNPQALGLTLKLIEAAKPDYVHIGGDAFDFEALSRFVKSWRRKSADALKEIRKPYQDFMRSVHSIVPDAIKTVLPGNHEVRFDHVVGETAFPITLYENYADICRVGGTVHWLDEMQEVWLGHLLMQHGIRYGESAAKAALFDVSMSYWVIGGHAHQPGIYMRRQPIPGVFPLRYRNVTSIVNGCLCNRPPAYSRHRTQHSKWIWTATVLDLDPKGDMVNPQMVTYHERRDGSIECFYGDKHLIEAASPTFWKGGLTA